MLDSAIVDWQGRVMRYRVDVDRVAEMVCELLPIEGEDIPFDRRMSNTSDRILLRAELGELEAPAEQRNLDTQQRKTLAERLTTARRLGDVPLALAIELVLSCEEPERVETSVVLACIHHCLESQP